MTEEMIIKTEDDNKEIKEVEATETPKETLDVAIENVEKTAKTFTQEELNHLIGKARLEGKSSVQKLNDEELKEFEKFKKSNQSDREQLEELKQTVVEKDKAINSLKTRQKVIESGVLKQYIDDVETLTLKGITKDIDFDESLKKILEKYPLFLAVKETKPKKNIGKETDVKTKSQPVYKGNKTRDMITLNKK